MAQSPQQTEFFEKKVRPVLAANCYACHSSKTKMAGIDLTTGDGLGEPQRITKVIGYEDRLKMPPSGKLAPEVIADLNAWVEMGGKWPAQPKSASAVSGVRRAGTPLSDKDKNFWSFRKVANPEPPTVKNTAWVKTPVDRFILAKLEEKGLQPAAPSSKLTLLRRATFDLTGLPPTPEECRAFEQVPPEKLDAAYEAAIDRLLASTAFGEHFATAWLDAARYADS